MGETTASSETTGGVASEAAEKRYRRQTRRSGRMYLHALKMMPGGQSHNGRFFEPYPFYASKARGKHIWDIDGNRYVDYWMGHTALIFGHSPAFVVKELRNQAPNGMLFGSPSKLAHDLATRVTEIVPSAESVRFCTTGAEATMYAVRLARSFTKGNTIVKMTGGWHGYNSALTVGVSAPYNTPESAGLISEDERFVKLARFNDEPKTKQILEENSKDIAGVIVEPVIGGGGVVPADKSYLEFLRKECTKLGAVLIFDEIITGFRLAPGGAQDYYGVKPDLCTLGKILGGGLPVSAIAGRSEIMDLADASTHREKMERCWIGGGTFSENALGMRAGIATLDHLVDNQKTIYSRIGNLGQKLRSSVDRVFAESGIRTQTTGVGSLFATHFLSPNQSKISSPEDVDASNRNLEKHYYFSLIAEHGIYFIPGHIGVISTAHSRSDIDRFV
ncbi:MAG: aspartate aminotransferase family protein, partial [Nitrososphaerales archaeon]